MKNKFEFLSLERSKFIQQMGTSTTNSGHSFVWLFDGQNDRKQRAFSVYGIWYAMKNGSSHSGTQQNTVFLYSQHSKRTMSIFHYAVIKTSILKKKKIKKCWVDCRLYQTWNNHYNYDSINKIRTKELFNLRQHFFLAD